METAGDDDDDVVDDCTQRGNRNGYAQANSRVVSVNNMVVSLNYCSQNGGNVYRAPYYNGNPNIGPRIIGNLDQSPHGERNDNKPISNREASMDAKP